MKFKVTGGVNQIGKPPTAQTNPTDNFGAHSITRLGSMLSPINGMPLPDRSITLPPSYATRIHDIVNDRMNTNLTEFTTKLNERISK